MNLNEKGSQFNYFKIKTNSWYIGDIRQKLEEWL